MIKMKKRLYQKQYIEMMFNSYQDKEISQRSDKNPYKKRIQNFIFQTCKDNLIKQLVKDPKLIPIPNQLYEYTKGIFKSSDNKLTKIPYKKLVQLCNVFDYQFSDQFKKSIEKNSNKSEYLLILYCNKEEIVNLLQKQYSLDFAIYVYNEISKMDSGRIFYERLDIQKNPTCTIFVSNQNSRLDNDSLDTVQHELTHFIQHAVGLEKTVQKFKYFENTQIRQDIIDLCKSMTQDVSNIENKNFFIRQLCQKYMYILSKRQIIQTIKKVINGFQRLYQRQYIEIKDGIIDYNKKELIKNDSIKTRHSWLVNYLMKINDNYYFKSEEFKDMIQDLEYETNPNCYKSIKNSTVWILLGYFGLKTIGYNIDSDLKNHFEDFELD